MVGQGDKATLTADKLPAYSNEEVNFDLETSLAMAPEMTVRVTNATGELVWMTTTSTFPVTWDMRDMNGNRVPGGLYRYFGTYNNGTNYGGTPISKLIVLDPVKTPLKHSTLPK
jgi:flagellar hook assembly protein FlgD